MNAILDKWNIDRLGSSDKYKDVLKSFTEGLINAYKSFIETFSAALASAFKPITNAFNSIYTGLTGAFGTIKTWLDGALTNITSGFSDMISWTSNNFFKTWESLTVHMTEFSDWTYSGMMKSWNGVLEGFDNAGLNITNKIQEVFGITEMGNFKFGERLAEAFKKIFAFDEGLLTDMFDTMQKVADKKQKDYMKEHIKDIGMNIK